MPPLLVVKSAVDATVSNEAVVDDLLLQVAEGGHELLMFDVNRVDSNSSMLVAEPGPLTSRLSSAAELPFNYTLVANRSTATREVSARYRPAHSAAVTEEQPLDVAWPTGVVSLSHVALPFPQDDPLYGAQAPQDPDQLFLGRQSLQGERGLMRMNPAFLFRLRHNPFYDYLEQRVVGWLEDNSQKP